MKNVCIFCGGGGYGDTVVSTVTSQQEGAEFDSSVFLAASRKKQTNLCCGSARKQTSVSHRAKHLDHFYI